jgi:uncharacterized protein YjbJ (UPF0337 family)
METHNHICLHNGGKTMNTNKDTFNNSKDKFAGEVKEAAGKVTGNQQLELKGKMQSSKADFKKKTNLHNNVNNFKEGVAEKVNDMMDKNEAKNKNK